MGTPAYMSPEQARGEAVDAQTDVWAFGCVLYEMLTARRAFGGSTASDSMAAVLQSEPDWSALPGGTSASVQRLLARCLAKDARRRLHSVADAQLELDDAPSSSTPAQTTRLSRLVWLAVGTAAAIGVGIGGYLYGRRTAPAAPTPPASSYVYDIPLPAGRTHWSGLALSPDGRRLALVTQGPQPADPRLWIRDLDSTADWQLVSGAGPEIPSDPFWSPDGRSLAFFVGPPVGELGGKLVRVDLPAVVPIEICAASAGRGGVWLDDGTILFAPSNSSGLERVESRGGTPLPLVGLKPGEVSLRYPSRAGPGRIIYLAQNSDPAKSEIRLLQLTDPARPASIVRTSSSGVYDRGTLFYQRTGVWVGQLFDPGRARFEGDARPLAVDSTAGGNLGEPPLSAQAGHVAVDNVRREQGLTTWVTRSGAVVARLGEPSAYQGTPEISPDGLHVAVSRAEPGEELSLWILDVGTGGKKRIAPPVSGSPVWHRDSTRIAFRSQTGVGGSGNLYEIDRDATRPPKAIYEVVGNLFPIGWLPGGPRFVFRSEGLAGSKLPVPFGVHILEADGRVTPFHLGRTRAARLSPDGTRIAYTSDELGVPSLVVDTFPVPGVRPVSVAHGNVANARWSADGRELYFAAEKTLMAAPISPGPALTVGPAVRLFDLPSNSYAVDPSGKRFLVMVPTAPAVPSVRITLNWSPPAR